MFSFFYLQSVAQFLSLAVLVSSFPIHGHSRSMQGQGQIQQIQWLNCTEFVPSPLLGTTLPDPLPSTLQCGNLVVPMDYSKCISPWNNITISFAMRRPQNPQGLVN